MFIGENTICTQSSTLCLESFNDVGVLSGAQEPWEGVFGHQSVDRLLCSIESVSTHRVHHTQQSLPSFGIQVYLRTEVSTRCSRQAFRAFLYHCTNLLRGIRVDKLGVDAAGFGLGRSIPVGLTGQPELQVLLAVF